MRITHEADYAVRIVYVMTKNGGMMPASQISQETGVTLRFTLKILRKLFLAGIVSSQKGASGGYMLAMKPEDISMGLIIESIDGPLELNHCLSGSFDCTRVEDKNMCEFHQIYDQLSVKLRQELYDIKMNTFKI
ncbi:MAG: Rrf2 family transcriptional regulator [Clostridia bacterium]|nr:Rrf2 family transcriptional regulator [Clostridia bacterium]